MGCGTKTEPRAKSPVRVSTAIAEVSQPNQEDGRQGYVGVVEENEAVAVSFTTMGSVRRVLVSEGQTVARGQLLAELDDTQARNLLDGARASVAQAEDALVRYGQLHEKGSMTDAQWVEVQSKVAQARSQLAVAEKNLADCRLVAPVAGIVGRRAVSAGETVMPSQPVVTILDISSVKVRFSVPEADMASITPQTSTCIAVEAIQYETHGGRIEKGVQADALTHTYDVRVRVNNKDKTLLPGMVAKVQMGFDGKTAFSLPLTAVQRRADGSLFVWTIAADSTAHRIPVSIGSTLGNRVEILSGLAVGQRVVCEGFQKLSEGTKVIY